MDVTELVKRLRDGCVPEKAARYFGMTHEVDEIATDILLNEAASALESQTARIAELESALKPFADAADALDASWTSGNFYKDEERTSVKFKAGTLRRARAALTGVVQ